ncbi:7921_t:CDS:2, partial [Funneliformis geosporum]
FIKSGLSNEGISTTTAELIIMKSSRCLFGDEVRSKLDEP